MQHAALETAALIGATVDQADLGRFLGSSFFHVQMSAISYLAAISQPDKMKAVALYVCDVKTSDMARALGLLFLEKMDGRNQADIINMCRLSLPKTSIMLGPLMDPRIGTSFPNSPRDGAERLLKLWGSKTKDFEVTN